MRAFELFIMPNFYEGNYNGEFHMLRNVESSGGGVVSLVRTHEGGCESMKSV